jgi:hypothetical protein
MTWRKCIVRSLVFLVAAGAAVAGWIYQHWTNPEVVRAQVLAKLDDYLPGASVALDSAHLQLFGGIAVNELHMARRDDPDKTAFAHLSSGHIYPDKQRVANGKLVIRKLEFQRPVINIVRRTDGTWNLSRNILATPDPRKRVPMIVLHQGTLYLEDRLCPLKSPPLEIKSLNLTIKNDPLPTLAFEGTGVNDVLGPVHLSGTWGRISGDLFVTFEFTNIPVGEKLVTRLASYLPEIAAHAQQLSGTGQLRADISFQPQSSRPWSYELHARLSRGKFRHPRLPQPLEMLEARARCVDGQITLESAVAQSGKTKWNLSNLTVFPGSEADLDGHLEVEHLPASAEVFQALPEKLHRLQQDFQPRGNFTISADFARRAGQWREHAIIRPERVTAAYEKFRYALDQVQGTVDQELDAARSVNQVAVKLVGRSGLQPVYIEGTVKLKPVAIDLKIWGKDIAIDDRLRSALPAEYQELVRRFDPSGLVDLDISIHRAPNARKAENHYVANFHDVALRYAVFPYPIENASGTLDIQPERWDVRDFHGSHKGGEFQARGRSAAGEHGKHMTIGIWGKNILLDDEMHGALTQPGLKEAWKKLSPKGRIDFEATVDQLGSREPDIAVSVALRECDIFPEFFPYLLSIYKGRVHYHHGELQLEDMVARHGLTELKLKEGHVYLRPGGELLLSLNNVGGLPVVPDADLLGALPRPLADTCRRLQVADPLSVLATTLIIKVAGDGTPPHIAWDAGVRFRDASFNLGVGLQHVTGRVWSRGEHRGTFGTTNGNIDIKEASCFNQFFSDIQTGFHIDKERPYRLNLVGATWPTLRGHLYGGDVGGEGYIDFGPNPQYEINLIGSQLQLEKFGRMNHLGPNARLQGMAEARLYVRGQGFAQDGLEGGGSIDVLNGKMYNLPFLLDLLKVLNLRLPDKTAFEEAHIQFGVRGQKAYVNQLSLIGNAVSLNGQGTMNLNGSDLNLDFYSIMGHSWPLPPVIDKIPPLISKQFLKIKVRGDFGKPQITKEPVPIIVEPLKVLFKYMDGGQR